MSLWSRFIGWIVPIFLYPFAIIRPKKRPGLESGTSLLVSRHRTAAGAALALRARFETSRDKKDLDNAIIQFRIALDLSPSDPALLSYFIVTYAVTLSDRFDLYSDGNDLDEAILQFQSAVQLPSDDPSMRFSWLTMLIQLLVQRFERKNEEKDIDDAVSYGRQAAEISPYGRCNQFALLAKAGIILWQRFLRHGDLWSLTNSILRYEEALTFPPADHSAHATCLIGLAWSLLERFDCVEDKRDLDGALLHSRQAVVLDPSQSKERHKLLHRAALKLKRRYSKHGDTKDLEGAILLYQEALDHFPVDSLAYLLSLFRQAAALISRFNHEHDQQDLEDAVQRFLEGLKLQGDGAGDNAEVDPFYFFLTAFGEQSHGDDKNDIINDVIQLLKISGALDDPILLLRHSKKTLPSGHPQYPQLLLYLGKALSRRYKTSSAESDSNDAINSLQEALALQPDNIPCRAEALNEIVQILSPGGESERGDLDSLLRYCREALALLPAGHKYRPGILISLGAAHQRIYSQTGEKWAMEKTISLLEESRLDQQFDHSVSSFMDDLDAFIKELHDDPKLPHEVWAIDNLLLRLQNTELLSGGSVVLGKLGDALCIRFEACRSHDPQINDDHLQSAMRFFKDAAHDQLSGPFQCLQASVRWAYNADKYEHSSDLEAYARCIYLIDIHLSTGVSLSSRHQMRINFPPYLAVNAASCALRRGDRAKALELLEQGRTFIWTQLSRYNTPVQTLMQGDENAQRLGQRFRELGARLNNPPITSAENVNKDADARSYRILIEDWNRVVAEIREIDEHSQFLLPPRFSELKEAASCGPIVVLVSSFKSCDAIIISSKGSPLHLPLQLTIDELALLANRLRTVVRRTHNDSEQDQQLRAVLQQVWDGIVEPVVTALEQVAEKRSRIWWCPTSIFAYIPLHAAGDYSRPNGRHLSQLYISSYTPSLSAFIRSRREYRAMSKSKKFAVIGQAQPAGDHPPLESVESEIDFVESVVRERVPTAEVTKIPSAISTKAVALDALRDNGWLHWSCHGVQEFEKPYDSSLRMRDGPLSLEDIAQADLRSHEFVFLSACETAVGELQTPDEVIHLAAGLQFSGVKSVVGTMWEVEDATVHYLVKAFYKNMFADGEMDCTKAARALHKALRSPDVKKMSLIQRVVFIHIGI